MVVLNSALVDPSVAFPSLWANDKAAALQACIDSIPISPACEAGICICVPGGRDGVPGNYGLRRTVTVPGDSRVELCCETGLGVQFSNHSEWEGNPTDPLFRIRAEEWPNPANWPSWLIIRGLMFLNTSQGPCIASALSPSGNRLSLQKFQVRDCRLTSENAYPVFMEHMGYCIHPEFVDCDFSIAGAIYWKGEAYTAAGMLIQGCRFHAGSLDSGGDKRQVGPGYFLSGVHLLRFVNNIGEGGSSTSPVGYRSSVSNPDAPDKMRTLHLLVENPGPRGCLVEGSHEEFYDGSGGYRYTSVVNRFTGGGPYGIGSVKLQDMQPSGLYLENVDPAHAMLVDFHPQHIGQFPAPATMELIGNVKLRVVNTRLGHLSESQLAAREIVRFDSCWRNDVPYDSVAADLDPPPPPLPVVMQDTFQGSLGAIDGRVPSLAPLGVEWELFFQSRPMNAGNGRAEGMANYAIAVLTDLHAAGDFDLDWSGSVSATGGPNAGCGAYFDFLDNNNCCICYGYPDQGRVVLERWVGGMLTGNWEGLVDPGLGISRSYRVTRRGSEVEFNMDGELLGKVVIHPPSGLRRYGIRLSTGDTISTVSIGRV